MKKKLLLFSVVLTAAFSMFSCGDSNGSFAGAKEKTDGVLTYNVFSDHAEVAKCSREAVGDITVPDYIGSVPVTVVGREAFYKCFNVKSVTLPDTMMKIDISAFDSCSGLAAINMGKGVISIGAMAFNDCDDLANVVLPESVSEIDKMAFHECGSLSSVMFMNPQCTIFDQAITICNAYTDDDRKVEYKGVICGYKGSTAASYAESCGYRFVSLDGGNKNSTVMKGDANGDGAVNSSDASLVMLAYSAFSTGDESVLTAEQMDSADINSDGQVNSKDASIILSYYSYLSTGNDISVEDFLLLDI